jgi:hypothetical protein
MTGMFARSRRKRKLTAWIVTALLLFAHTVQAAEACLQALLVAPKVVASESMPGCHDMSSKAGCVAQWIASDQSSGHTAVAVFEAPAVAVLRVPVTEPRVRATIHGELIPPVAAPPPAIRFCSFLL